MRSSFLWLWLIALLVISSGCSRKVLYSKSERLPAEGWSMHQDLIFTVPVSDTLQSWDLYLQVRNGARYEWSNLWLFVETHAPTGTWIRDTLEFRLADERGKWLGRGIGDRFTVEFPFKRHVVFPHSGTYRFMVSQGMRDTLLEHIADIGLRIEKSTED